MYPRHSRATYGFIFAVTAIIIIAACRIWLADTLPLTDTTEARFSEMARKMVETGDWLTPQHDYGIPYLAKPPLAMWLSALGIRIFGAGELAPRILILAASLGFCIYVFRWCARELGREAAIATVLVLSSSLLFFASTAAVMTDMILTITVSTTVLAFWRRTHGGGLGSELAMFVSLGLGLLAKGPLAAVLAAVPIIVWTSTHRRAAAQSGIAWVRGLLLVALIAAPWYLAAEWRNPGFLRYFLIGEHIERFLVPGWAGDLYGRAHDAPRGTIWLFFLIGLLPWPVVYAVRMVLGHARIRANWRQRRELIAFLAVSALTPLALFTFSGNIILPYALPAIPATAIAIVAIDSASLPKTVPLRTLATTATLSALAVTLAVALARPYVDRHTQRGAIEAIDALSPAAGVPIYYWNSRYFSADYYSRGRSRSVRDAGTLEAILSADQPFFLVIPDEEAASAPALIDRRTQRVARSGEMTILKSVSGTAALTSTRDAR